MEGLYKRALYVGRFQPFHIGHLYAVKYILERAEEIVIAVGSSQFSNTIRNPLSVDERYEMIIRALRQEGIPLRKVFLVNIPDTESPEEDWGLIVLDRVPRIDVAYSNDPETIKDLTSVGVKVLPIPFYERDRFSATNIRELILEGNNAWKSLVPPAVFEFLKSIGMEERIRKISSAKEPL
ncbi:MAG TPA: nicotinamide-nucleotide adenylyltransferase [Candidatus Korarchaeota archaeon]|nr:nicotinamide-nucleotide adenylyltransferase [Candidatus Korarchaeota archaeon]